MSRKIRILQSMDTVGVGGTEVFVMNLYRSIDRDNFQFDFIVFDDYKTDFLDEILKNGDKVFQFRQRRSSRFLNYLDQKRFAKSIFKGNKYDIVHCNGNSFLGLLRTALPAKKAGMRIITHSHNMGEKKDSIIDRIGREYLRGKVSSAADLGYTCSDLAGNAKYTDEFRRSKKYKIINNGIDAGKYGFNRESREKVRGELGVSEDVLVIGHVGRFEYPKNQSYLFDIFLEVLRIEPCARLVLVGDGIQREEFERKITQLGIGDNVTLLGLRMDVNELYSGMDLFVLPSIHEGFPFVLVEAQMNGLRCVVTENMSRDVNISGGVTFLSVHAAPAIWAREILNKRARLFPDQIQKVISRYDMRRIAREIEKDYYTLMK